MDEMRNFIQLFLISVMNILAHLIKITNYEKVF